MINNWEYRNLNMDFSSMYPHSNHPSDIDMFYITKDNTLIIAEIKNEQGVLKDGQRRLLERLVNGWQYGAIAIYATHRKLYQKGDRTVYVPDCEIKEMYVKSEKYWRVPARDAAKVKDLLEYFGLYEIRR